MCLQRSYADHWYSNIEASTVPVGFKILVVDSNIGNGNNLQRDITEHQGNNVWKRMCFLYTKDDPIPEYHRDGRKWLTRQGAAMKGIQEQKSSADNYENRKFYDNSSLFFMMDAQTDEFNFDAPGKVEWVYEKPEEKVICWEDTNEDLWKKAFEELQENSSDPINPISEVNEFYANYENMSDEEKKELPTFEVIHRYRTRDYNIFEPFALTPMPVGHAEMHTHYEKIRQNLIIQYMKNKK